MNGNDLLTNYLVDTSGVSKYFDETLPDWALALLDEVIEQQQPHLSVIVRIELKVYKPLIKRREAQIQEFIDSCMIHDLTEEIVLQTIKIRRHYRTKLPDAIIAATAIVNDFTLLSTNDSDFEKITGLKYRSLNQ